MPAPTSPWPAVLPAALAGTRRQPFTPLPGLTPLLGNEAAAPEKQLLLTAANLRLVQRAGWRPVPDAGAAALAPAAEVLPETGPAATALLTQLLTTERPLRLVVLRHFLRLLGQHRQRVPHRLLRPLADLLYRVHYQFLFNMLRDEPGGLGNRGLALLRLAANWPLGDWARQLGTGWVPGVPAHEQPWALGELARQGPHGQGPAMSWLFQRLAAEPGLDELDEIWWVLRQWTAAGPLPPEAGPLLDPLVQLDEAPPDPALPGNPRRAYHGGLAGLRAAMPDSDLPERCWQLARPHLTLAASSDGSPILRLGLPAAQHAPASPTEAGPQPDQLLSEWLGKRLGEWLSLVPPSRWAAAWRLTPEQAVAAVAASGPAFPVVLPAWVRAAATFGEGDFLAALASCYRQYLHHQQPGTAGFLPLLTSFRDPERLLWLHHLAPELPLPAAASYPGPLLDIWRQALSRAAHLHNPVLLRGILPLLVASQQPSQHPESDMLAQLLAYYLLPYAQCPDLSILPELRAAFGPGIHPYFAEELPGVLDALQTARDFEAALLTPAGRQL